MKNSKLLRLFIVIGFALALVGCAEEKSSDSATAPTAPFVSVPNGEYVPPGVGPGLGSGGIYGGSADLNIVSLATMSQYTKRAMNNPTNIKVNVNFVKVNIPDVGIEPEVAPAA